QMSRDTKRVLVTGASRGIGRAVARRFAADGYHVLANDLARQSPALATLRQEVVSAGGGLAAVTGHVSDAKSVDDMIRSALAAHGEIDVLVNNAGVISNLRIEKIAPEEWDRMFTVNTKGTFLVSKALLAHFRARGSGRIINIASIGGKL